MHAPEPFFLPGSAGALYALYYPAAAQRGRGEAVLFVPPFAEEMNKSRRMVALMARRLQTYGLAALTIDLYGTGDSAGDFAAARWSTWLEDLSAAASWLREQGNARLHVVALRLGALLANAWIGQSRAPALGQLVLWQPVTHGAAFLTQFLRLRLAARMLDRGAEQESTQALRGRLAAGETIEVAGYALAPALAQAIDGASLEPPAPARVRTASWLEVAASAARPLTPASAQAVERWRGAGVSLAATTVAGEPFWSTPETTLAPQLLDRTADIFARERNDAARSSG